MPAQHTEVAKIRPLEILGISELEERVYRWLLIHPGSTASETVQALTLTPIKVQRLLDGIESKGLVTNSLERPRRYIPISPDIALEALALKHQKNLQHARSAIQELQERVTAVKSSVEQEQMVELITSREAQRLIIEQIARTAQHDVIALIRPPMLISRLDLSRDQDQFTKTETSSKGVRFRNIVDMELLALPGAVSRVWEDMKAGEDTRIYPHLPIKMVLVDRRVAVIPLDLQRSDSPSLLVRSSALFDALYAMFELLWERATPVSFTRAGIMAAGKADSLLPKKHEDLIALMASGLNDKKIAFELHFTVRMLRRHIAELMKVVGARTRFQAGWLAAIRLSGQSID